MSMTKKTKRSSRRAMAMRAMMPSIYSRMTVYRPRVPKKIEQLYSKKRLNGSLSVKKKPNGFLSRVLGTKEKQCT